MNTQIFLYLFTYPYLCTSSFISYQERQRDWPCDALATMTIYRQEVLIPVSRIAKEDKSKKV